MGQSKRATAEEEPRGIDTQEVGPGEAYLTQEGLTSVGKWLGKILSAPGKTFDAKVVNTVQLGSAAALDALEAALPIPFAGLEGKRVKLHAEITLWLTMEEKQDA